MEGSIKWFAGRLGKEEEKEKTDRGMLQKSTELNIRSILMIHYMTNSMGKGE